MWMALRNASPRNEVPDVFRDRLARSGGSAFLRNTKRLTVERVVSSIRPALAVRKKQKSRRQEAVHRLLEKSETATASSANVAREFDDPMRLV
jgi:hypothetical protein